MENLIIYYSWTGNTEAAASEISALIGGKTERLCEEKLRKSFMGSAFSAIIGNKSKLKPLGDALPEDGANIFLGTPIWASHCAPAINTFLDKADLKGKKVFLFFTLASEAAPEKLIKSMEYKIEAKGGKVCGSVSLQTKKGVESTPETFKERVASWIGTLQL